MRFAEPAERELFEHFLSVSGVGPEVALAILSSSTPADLRRAIALEDTTRFIAIPGIGEKTAERVVLELKEKIGALEVVDAPREQGSSPVTPSLSSATRSWRLNGPWRRPTSKPSPRSVSARRWWLDAGLSHISQPSRGCKRRLAASSVAPVASGHERSCVLATRAFHRRRSRPA